MQNKGYYGIQGHSKSSRSILIESPYATDFLLVINTNWHPGNASDKGGQQLSHKFILFSYGSVFELLIC